jgi:hypothetical protein
LIVSVVWPGFGRISGPGGPGGTVEPVGVAVHVAGVEVTVQVEGRGDAGVPLISWSIFGGYPAWIISEAAVCLRS